jgi:fatty acid-binding protein DegV
MASGNFNKDDWHLVVVYFDTDEKLIEFAKNQLEENLPGYEILTTPLSINVCAHTGPGTIGIGISRKPNH